MRYVQINAYANGWADSIVFSKHRELLANGDESWVFWGRGKHEQDSHLQKIASYPEICMDAISTRLDGRAGFHSRGVTRRLLKKLDEIDPDVVHLHLLLGYYINIEMLFEWLARHRCKVLWTLHDCWAFTGHCIHFVYAKCDQWKTGCAVCASCPQKQTYPETYLGGDKSVRWCYERKKRLFTMLSPDRLSLITPSQWLANLVKQSFLSKYSIEVRHNPVDTHIFRPTESDFRKRYSIDNRFMILGVASKWSERKGLREFISLARELDPSRFSVVVVGLGKNQIKQAKRDVPTIVALPRTKTPQELAQIYTAADVLLNPSAEETFGMNVAEAAACGTRSIVVKGSACAEVASNAAVIPADLSGLDKVIERLCNKTAS